jgi:hypothetical protein
VTVQDQQGYVNIQVLQDGLQVLLVLKMLIVDLFENVSGLTNTVVILVVKIQHADYTDIFVL